MKKASWISLLLCVYLLMQGESIKMNVLFIAVDDLRPQTNFYGEEQMIPPQWIALPVSPLSSIVHTAAYPYVGQAVRA